MALRRNRVKKQTSRSDRISYKGVNDEILKLISDFHGIEIKRNEQFIMVRMNEHRSASINFCHLTWDDTRLITDKKDWGNSFLNLNVWLDENTRIFKPLAIDKIIWDKVPKDTVVTHNGKRYHFCGLSNTKELGKCLRLYEDGRSSLTSGENWFRVSIDEVNVPFYVEDDFGYRYTELIKIGAIERNVSFEVGDYLTDREDSTNGK